MEPDRLPHEQQAVPEAARDDFGGALGSAASVLGFCAFIPLLGIASGLLALVLSCIVIARGRGGMPGAKVGALAAGIGIIAHGVVLLGLTRTPHPAYREICPSNLNGIGKAIMIYYADSRDAFPALPLSAAGYDPDKGISFKGAPQLSDSIGSLAGGFPQDDLSLLVYKGYFTWKMFLCPSTGNMDKDRIAPGSKYGFGGPAGSSYIDYGLQVPYRYIKTPSGVVENKAWLSANAAPDLAIMADRPPAVLKSDGYCDESATSALCNREFSPNHGGKGESVLYAGGNVKWSEDTSGSGSGAYKNAGGWGLNNIYQFDMSAGDALDRAGAAFPKATVSIYDSIIYWRRN